MNRGLTVFVGLSGGVDSSVAAARLLARGYNVVGVFIKVWHPDFMICNWEQERLDAMRVAAHLEIPFLTCDAVAEYRDQVATEFINEYKAGRTPNPDVLCNQNVKFGAFLRFAKQHGADFIATGHYAQKLENKLVRGLDKNKDQTYFLWTLAEEQLDYTLFPVGDTTKENIRLEADKYGVPTASKKDSQGICFLGHVDIPEFLSHYVELKEGNVLNENKQVIGAHKGALVYTNGQRHGFTLNTDDDKREPMYVISRDLEHNTITVSNQKPLTKQDNHITLENVITRSPLVTGEIIQAQFRYRQDPFLIEVIRVSEKSITLRPTAPTELPAGGQSCVLYRDNVCVGGGIIS
jgi:tRNA-specific 2-thiouridylase